MTNRELFLFLGFYLVHLDQLTLSELKPLLSLVLADVSKLLPNHLRQHPLHRCKDALVFQQLLGNRVVSLLPIDDDISERILEVAQGELLLRVVRGLLSEFLALQQPSSMVVTTKRRGVRGTRAVHLQDEWGRLGAPASH